MKTKKQTNKVIKTLITSDIFLNSGWGLIGPIFAIFLLQSIEGGNAAVAGMAAAIYWIVKSLLQIPIGKYLDRNHGEIDDFYFMFAGLMLAGFVPFGFLFASLPWHIYALQALYGLGMAMNVPAWYAIFTRHIDHGKEAYEWGLASTVLGFSVGLASAIGGLIVYTLGFRMMFVVVGLCTFASAGIYFFIRKDIIARHVPGQAAKTPPIK